MITLETFQLLDEISILWVIMAGFALWWDLAEKCLYRFHPHLTCRFPREVLPGYFGCGTGEMRFRTLCLLLTLISTLLGFLQPVRLKYRQGVSKR